MILSPLFWAFSVCVRVRITSKYSFFSNPNQNLKLIKFQMFSPYHLPHESWLSKSVSSFFERRSAKDPRDTGDLVLPSSTYSSPKLLDSTFSDAGMNDSWLEYESHFGQFESHSGRFENHSFNGRTETKPGFAEKRPTTASPCSRIDTVTYHQMVAARIGVRSQGLETYHTFDAIKSNKFENLVSLLLHNRLNSLSRENSPQRSSRGGLLTDLSLKGKAPQRCYQKQDLENKMSVNKEKMGELDCVISFVRSVPEVGKFKHRFSLFRYFYPTNFWNNYMHLETEVEIFHEDYEFIRKTFARTCGAICEKRLTTQKFLEKALYCSAEYQHLFTMLQHIESSVAKFGPLHHESHFFKAQRNLHQFESEFQQLLCDTQALDELREKADKNLFGLKQCLEVNQVHRRQCAAILREFELFCSKYGAYDRLVQHYILPLYSHFSDLKEEFSSDSFCEFSLQPFQRSLRKAASENSEAHDMMNETVKLRQAMPRLLVEVTAKLRQKQLQSRNHLVVDGVLREVDLGQPPRSWSRSRSRSRSRSASPRKVSPERTPQSPKFKIHK